MIFGAKLTDALKALGPPPFFDLRLWVSARAALGAETWQAVTLDGRPDWSAPDLRGGHRDADRSAGSHAAAAAAYRSDSCSAAGISHALNGLAVLVADPAWPVPRGYRVRLHVPDWLPSLVNAGRVFVTIGAVELFWIITQWPNGALAITFAAIGVLLSRREPIGKSRLRCRARP